MIPQIIHHIWISGDFKYRDYRLSWMWHNPDYTFMFHRLDKIIRPQFDAKTLAILDDPNIFFLLKVEILKFHYVYQYGGIYADTDMECQKNFDDLMSVGSFAGIESPDGNIGNAIFAAYPQDSRIKNIYSYIVNTIADLPDVCNNRPVKMVGERAAFIQAEMSKFEYIHERETFYPFDIVELDKRNNEFPNSYTKHHWTGKSKDGWIESAEKFLKNKKG